MLMLLMLLMLLTLLICAVGCCSCLLLVLPLKMFAASAVDDYNTADVATDADDAG